MILCVPAACGESTRGGETEVKETAICKYSENAELATVYLHVGADMMQHEHVVNNRKWRQHDGTRFPAVGQCFVTSVSGTLSIMGLTELVDDPVCPTQTRSGPLQWRDDVTLLEFKGHRGQAARHAGASGGGGQRQSGGCERTTITQTACGFQLLAKISHSLWPRFFSRNYPIPPSAPLAALPTPTLDRTQIV